MTGLREGEPIVPGHPLFETSFSLKSYLPWLCWHSGRTKKHGYFVCSGHPGPCKMAGWLGKLSALSHRLWWVFLWLLMIFLVMFLVILWHCFVFSTLSAAQSHVWYVRCVAVDLYQINKAKFMQKLSLCNRKGSKSEGKKNAGEFIC